MGTLIAPVSVMTPNRLIAKSSSAYTIPSSFSVTSYASLYSVPTDTLNTNENQQSVNTLQLSPAISNYSVEINSDKKISRTIRQTNSISTFKHLGIEKTLLNYESSHLRQHLQRLEVLKLRLNLQNGYLIILNIYHCT